MRKLVLSDIFGITDELQEFCAALKGNIELLSPYAEKEIAFESEPEAYNYFNKVTSLDRYSQLLYDKIGKGIEPVSILGFSIGGSAIWALSENKSLKTHASAVCYYPGQIRYHTGINPCFRISLIMAAYEQHFSASELSDTLVGKSNVKVHLVNCHHGFMNHSSENFNEPAFALQQCLLQQLSPEQAFTEAQFIDAEKRGS